MKDENELRAKLDIATKDVEINATYRHYKGNNYKVLEIALIESNLIPAVVYQAQYGEKLKFIRSIDDWCSMVDYQGKSVARFTRVE